MDVTTYLQNGLRDHDLTNLEHNLEHIGLLKEKAKKIVKAF